MNKKKIFGIGAAFLMILLAITPIVTSKTFLSNDNENLKVANSGGWDLALDLVNCAYSYYRDLNHCVGYDFTVLITNVDTETYHGLLSLKVITLCEDSKTYYVDFPMQIFDIAPGDTEPAGTSLELYSSEFPKLDHERYFAGKFISVELLINDPAGDPNPSNNIDYGYSKPWNDNSEPTEPQVEVGSPHTYQEVSVDRDLSYLNMINITKASKILKDRMGWVYDLAVHFYWLNFWITKIITNFTQFTETVESNVTTIVHEIKIFLDWVKAVLKGETPDKNILEMLGEFFDIVLPELKFILDEAIKWGVQALQDILGGLLIRFYDFRDWALAEPCKNDITVKGTLEWINSNDEVTITCRNYFGKWKDETDGVVDGKIKFSFKVSPDPKYSPSENYYWWIHDCTVYLHSNYHQKDKSSIKILSFAFSDGTMEITDSITFKTNAKDKATPNILLLFEKIFSNSPLLSYILNNLFSPFFTK